MKRFSLSSLRTRLVLLVLLGVIPALMLILYTSWLQRDLAAKMVRSDAMRLARMAAIQEDQLSDGSSYLLMALAQIPAIRNQETWECNIIFRKILKANPTYANLGLVDLKGNVIASAIRLKAPVNVADRAYFIRAIQTQSFSIGTYQVGRITNKATINFGYPVHDIKGQRITAVVFAALDLDWLNNLIKQVNLPRHASFLAIDQIGTILLRHPDPEKLVGKTLSNDPLVRAVMSQDEGTLELSGLDGIRRLYGFLPMGFDPVDKNIHVAVGIPAKVAFAEVNKALTINLIGLALAAALAILAAWYGGDVFILRHVRSLLNTTRRLSAGDLGARTGLNYAAGELGQLACSFDEMAESLERRVAERRRAEMELTALNEALEKRVAERTQELMDRTRLMEADLEMARDLQQAFLPQRHPVFPCAFGTEESALRFFSRYHPTGRVGGDFFDVFALSESEAGVFICDVMGQGVRAALVTAIVRGLVEELKPMAGDVGRFLTGINRGLTAVFRQTGTPMFASAFYMVTDISTGLIRYTNAGHPDPFHLHCNSGLVEPLRPEDNSTEPAMGLMEDFVYTTHSSSIAPGDMIVLFTDGLFEVIGPDDEEYGPYRLMAAVRKRINLPPLEMFDELLTEIQQFSATRTFADDVCLIGMQVAQNGVEFAQTQGSVATS